jgi:hypothetical protein
LGGLNISVDHLAQVINSYFNFYCLLWLLTFVFN